MDADTLRALQAPLKDKYKAEPEAALVTLRARSRLTDGIACRLETGRALVEMLRARYAIPRLDCVTHAQVSVNRDNGEIGWHTDFASGFPFEELGLPDNYALPPASLYLAGFDYDRGFLRSAGSPMLRGIDLAEGMLHREAISVNLSESRYRGKLRERYQNLSRSRP